MSGVWFNEIWRDRDNLAIVSHHPAGWLKLPYMVMVLGMPRAVRERNK